MQRPNAGSETKTVKSVEGKHPSRGMRGLVERTNRCLLGRQCGLQPLAAASVDLLACDPAAIVGRQERDDLGDIGRMADTA